MSVQNQAFRMTKTLLNAKMYTVELLIGSTPRQPYARVYAEIRGLNLATKEGRKQAQRIVDALQQEIDKRN